MNGTIFDISRFRTEDGPGIRTAVFLKGCPLKCVWCHNPESHKSCKELFFYRDRCVLCRACAALCDCHSITDIHTLNRQTCIACGKCAEVCPNGALKIIGRTVTPEEVIRHVLKDRVFYEKSGGGITITGGEPLFQPEFTYELARLSRNAGINVALETSGFGKEADFRKIYTVTDYLLFDYKLSDENSHRKYVGCDLQVIVKHLSIADSMGKNIELRCPLIPNINDNENHMEGIIFVAQKFPNIRKITLEPYHPLGISKRVALEKDVPYANEDFCEKATAESFRASISSRTGVLTVIQ